MLRRSRHAHTYVSSRLRLHLHEMLPCSAWSKSDDRLEKAPALFGRFQFVLFSVYEMEARLKFPAIQG